MQPLDTVSILKQDYDKFPNDQNYSIYAENFYFEDPFNKFHGVEMYKQMIALISDGLINIELNLLELTQSGNIIKTQWMLSWTAPFPWQPRVNIPGRSEAELNDDGLIVKHIDYWDIPASDVLKQLFQLI
ncbi:MAG: DUF2358 domain-containing protein [Komarekiella atlantica HA4396-MV6]|jgi:hypothetical protein|nr:DUF2358 domain-containing protein [Komarekiella atlantica HA4396-MV6]